MEYRALKYNVVIGRVDVIMHVLTTVQIIHACALMLVKIISIQVPVHSMSPFEFDATYNGRPIMEWVFFSTARASVVNIAPHSSTTSSKG